MHKPGKTYHMRIDVRGAIANLRGWPTEPSGYRDHGREITRAEARDGLLDELAKGHDYLPLGECDNFDFKSGCLGHSADVLPAVAVQEGDTA